MTTFALGQSLWILYFVPLEIPKLDDERQNYFSLYILKHLHIKILQLHAFRI